MNRYLQISIVVILLAACADEKPTGIHKNGRLEYKITYLNEHNGNFDPATLPKKMVLEFNEEFCTNTIDGFMGFFRLGNLTYFNRKKNITHLKVLDKNYVFTGKKNEQMCCFDTFEDMIIKKDTTTKIIAGLKSYHATASIPGIDEVFDIYYTYDINLKHPNVTNPYLEIEGVLTDFVLFMGPYKMRFEANKFYPDKYPKDNLRIPDKAVDVSRAEMVYVLERLME